MGVFRGYFQAHQTTFYTSVSQIIEQIFNAIVAIGCAYLFIKPLMETGGSEMAAAGAAGGAVGPGIGVLVGLIFMMIIMYGVMIATSVTTEKSNRSIEVLVTSTSSNSLIFGKVIAGAIAGICQVGIILGAILLSYQINREAWNGFLDPYLNIPIDVLVTFALFGIGGYLFYAFLYGAVGALVSKTEDINKSSSGLQMVIMIVYFVVLVQLTNVDGIVIKVASFLPFSSYSAMFARVAMGNVEMWEIIVSFIILVVSVVAAGLIGAKIYRMGTLRYGNPVKFSHALKSVLRKE